MDFGLILLAIVVMVVVSIIVDWLILKLLPNTVFARKIRNKKVLDQAENKVKTTDSPVTLHVDKDGNITIVER